MIKLLKTSILALAFLLPSLALAGPVTPYVCSAAGSAGNECVLSPVGSQGSGIGGQAAIPMPVQQNMAQITALTVSASGTTNGADQTNSQGKCADIGINITTLTGTTPTLTVNVQGKDVSSVNYYTILASAALSATGFTVLKICPGMTAAANTVANDFLPETYRIQGVTGGTITAIAATVGVAIVE